MSTIECAHYLIRCDCGAKGVAYWQENDGWAARRRGLETVVEITGGFEWIELADWSAIVFRPAANLQAVRCRAENRPDADGVIKVRRAGEVETNVMTEDEGISILDLPLETQWQLWELSHRRADIGEEAFADGVAAALEIPRELLDKAVVIQAADEGLRQMVERDEIDFDDAYEVAKVRLAKKRN